MSIETDTSEYLTRFNATGICEVNVDAVVRDWNDEDWVITEHGDTYRLYRHNEDADNFTRSDLKCEISKNQAHELIERLNLVATQNSVFRLARTWRKTYGER